MNIFYSWRYEKYILEQPSEKNAVHSPSAQMCNGGKQWECFSMMKTFAAGIVISAIAFGAFAAFAATSDPAKMGDTSKGKVWVDAKGMTLYTFDKDTSGKSNCNDKCATAWPPLQAAADSKAAGDWTIVARADGSKQWAYEGKPFYLWIKDKKPGDVTGDGVEGFHIAK
jgi:predicted lipoprotein with Yx(FWY)xxD motif